jgi:hypothetical protein
MTIISIKANVFIILRAPSYSISSQQDSCSTSKRPANGRLELAVPCRRSHKQHVSRNRYHGGRDLRRLAAPKPSKRALPPRGTGAQPRHHNARVQGVPAFALVSCKVYASMHVVEDAPRPCAICN